MLQQFKDWLAKPFSTDMDVKSWALFVGLILIIVWFWHRTIAVFTNV
jgi:hypothetical protein